VGGGPRPDDAREKPDAPENGTIVPRNDFRRARRFTVSEHCGLQRADHARRATTTIDGIVEGLQNVTQPRQLRRRNVHDGKSSVSYGQPQQSQVLVVRAADVPARCPIGVLRGWSLRCPESPDARFPTRRRGGRPLGVRENRTLRRVCGRARPAVQFFPVCRAFLRAQGRCRGVEDPSSRESCREPQDGKPKPAGHLAGFTTAPRTISRITTRSKGVARGTGPWRGGGSIPYQPWAAAKRVENFSETPDGPDPLEAVLPAWCGRAIMVHGFSVPISSRTARADLPSSSKWVAGPTA